MVHSRVKFNGASTATKAAARTHVFFFCVFGNAAQGRNACMHTHRAQHNPIYSFSGAVASVAPAAEALPAIEGMNPPSTHC
mmetsp:Transcript_9358/g.19641  ORF Transcript_9358/g.19641 Transcript_9358/m.19641 type:complete len:81 (+) Transcript_9358:152-394(+)